MLKPLALLILPLLMLSGCNRIPTDAPPTVAGVDIPRYMGTWYEIASFPNRFQKGCTATTATYRLREDGKVAVTNRCRLGSPMGEENVAEATARLDPDQPDGSRLLVSFFPLIEGNYWILALDPDYQWVLVGAPGRDYLWILSRTPQMAPELYDQIVAKAAGLGFDVTKLQRTVQP